MPSVPTFASIELGSAEELTPEEAQRVLTPGVYLGLLVEPPDIGEDFYEVPQKTAGASTGYMRQRYEPTSGESQVNWGTASQTWGVIVALGIYETFMSAEPTHVVRFISPSGTANRMSINTGESACVSYRDLRVHVGKYERLRQMLDRGDEERVPGQYSEKVFATSKG